MKEKEAGVNDLKIFNNAEFGQIRTVEINGKIYFVGKDIANALGYSNPRDAIARHCKGVVKHDSFKEGGQEVALIPEGDMYRLITHSKLESAERFESWVFDEVLPAIRQHGHYENPNMSTEMRAILMIDQKQVKMEQRMDKLEFDIPLYGSEADELSGHVKRKGVQILGGKEAPAYKDAEIRSRVYRDMYDQIKREFGIYDDSGRSKSYKALKRKYIADAHELIDCYQAPTCLEELIEEANTPINEGAA
jgi:prophage antirepressor-like protein